MTFATSMSQLSRALLVFLAPAFLYAEGIFADFTIRRGDNPSQQFSLELFYNEAPQTCANFIGLATGEKAWIDFATGNISNDRFYDGIIFHRVVNNDGEEPFVIQGGSPDGTGGDGPGYTFVDEFDPGLRHDQAGILSMANSGPNTNGSQFFITLSASQSVRNLDDRHTVFGEVADGPGGSYTAADSLAVVEQIGNVPLTSQSPLNMEQSRPVDPVVIASVTIRREGAAAENFDIHAQGLPTVHPVSTRLELNGESFELLRPNNLDRDTRIFVSSDLFTWGDTELVSAQRDAGGPSLLDVSSLFQGESRRFLTLVEIEYDSPPYPPRSLAGGLLTVDSNPVLEIDFANDNSGTWRLLDGDGSEGPFSSALFFASAFRHSLQIGWGLRLDSPLTLIWDTATTGTIRTQFLDASGNQTGPFEATFTWAPPGS